MTKEDAYLKAWMGTILAVILLAVIAIGADYILASREVPEDGAVTGEPAGPVEIPAPGTITISGTFICLPHKDTSGPQTLECAAGLKGDDGLNYALDLATVTYPAGVERARVTGHFVPTEALSTDQWQKYDMRGIISVEVVDPL